jgi:restriction system protein
MTIPTQSDIGLPLLELLSNGKLFHYDALEKKISLIFQLSDEEKSIKKSSGVERLLHNRIRWSLFYMEKAGLVNRPKRAHVKISEKGIEILKTNPQKINYQFLNDIKKSSGRNIFHEHNYKNPFFQ